MSHTLSIEDIEREAENEHITANELDILVAKTRELTHLKEQEIERLQALNEQLQARLKQIS